ncbi:MAG: serine hydrolase [Ornithinimicrobium sp.]
MDEELSTLSQQRHVLAARVEDGQCVPVFEHESDQAAPSGSAFKVYVLGAVVDAVERGDLTWDQELTVTEEIRSLPGGTLQEAPAGTKVSVRRAAELMISISDNTATDMLIDALGVQAVEEAYTDMGLSDNNMDGLTPLPTTAQLFQLGWGVDDDIRQQWSGADTQTQREILADLPEGVADIDPLSVTEPRWEEGVDYFISAADLCAAHVALQERAQTPAGEPVRAIVAENVGIPSVAAGFDYLAFKGGSVPGQLTLTWYGEVDDVAVVAIVQVATDEQIDANQVLGPAADVLTLLRTDDASN